jgi:GNAT superfamily N-acetyltransferase
LRSNRHSTQDDDGQEVEILALHPEDWRLIRQVRLDSLRQSPHAFASSYSREAKFDESTWRDRATTCHWFVAVDEGEPIGVAGGVDGWSNDRAKRELVGMWVAPSHRGRGIARHLLGTVGQWARSEGATILCLGVRQGNQGARSAYLRMGLRLSGETMALWDDPSESIEIMEWDLPSG